MPLEDVRVNRKDVTGVAAQIGAVLKYGFVGTVTGGPSALNANGYWDSSGYHAIVVYRDIPYPQGGSKSPAPVVSLYLP